MKGDGSMRMKNSLLIQHFQTLLLALETGAACAATYVNDFSGIGQHDGRHSEIRVRWPLFASREFCPMFSLQSGIGAALAIWRRAVWPLGPGPSVRLHRHQP